MKSNSLDLASDLYDEIAFYPDFINDLEHPNKEIIIKSPYITTKRMTGG